MLPDNLTTFLDKHVWIKRIGVYASIFAGIVLAFIFIFAAFKLIFPDFSIINNTVFTEYNTTQLRDMGFFDNERYLISALVQSLAATIALVITLSLVAVQLAAQSYSARVIDVYKNNPDMWILLSIYIAVIFYGLGLLKVIDIDVAGINMELAIFAAYFLGFFAFVCLVPYMLKTLDLLKPSTVIKLLAEEITKEKILEALEKDEEITEKDPVQSIADMMNRSLERNDYETMRNCLYAIKCSTFNIFKGLNSSGIEETKISHQLVLHLECAGIYAVNKNNEEALKSIVNSLKEIGDKTIQLRLNEAENKVIMALRIIGIKAAEQKLELTTTRIVFGLCNMGLKELEQIIQNNDTMLFYEVRSVGAAAAEQKLKGATHAAVTSLVALQRKAHERENQIAENEIKSVLNDLENLSKENGWNFCIPPVPKKYEKS